MANNVQELIQKAECGDEQAMVKLAVHYISEEEDLTQAAQWANRIAKSGKKSGIIIAIKLHMGCALKWEEKRDWKSAILEWKCVKINVEYMLKEYHKGDSSILEEEANELEDDLEKAVYSISKDMFLEESLDKENTNSSKIWREIIDMLEKQTSLRIKVLLGVSYYKLDNKKRAYELLQFLQTDLNYAQTEKDFSEECVFLFALMEFAVLLTCGIAGQMPGNRMQAYQFLKLNAAFIRDEQIQKSLSDFIDSSYSDIPPTVNVVTRTHKMDNGKTYSDEYMKKAVNLCMRRLALKKIIFEGNQSLNEVFVSDEEYVKIQLGSLTQEFTECFWVRLLVSWFFFAIIIGIVFGVFMKGKSDLEIFLLFPVFHIGRILFMRKMEARNVRKSVELQEYVKRREYRDAHRNEIKQLVNSTSKELRELETSMEDRTVCIIPKQYWDVAGMLWDYIDNRRADNLKEAINLHEQLNQEAEIKRMVSNIYSIARNTQSAAEQACFEAEMARISSESADSHARNAEFWAMMNYYSR